MTAQILYGIDFKNKTKDHKVAEGPVDFAAMEAEIAGALWNSDAGTVGLNPYHIRYTAPEKDGA